MQLEDLPSRLDPESVVGHFAKIGWPTVEVGAFYEVSPSPETPALLISHYSYEFCGSLIRPVYSKFTVQTYLDPGTVGTVMMSAAFVYLGALSIWEFDANAKEITFCYRTFIPGEIDDHVMIFQGCLAASTGARDLQDQLRRLHQEPGHPSS